MQSYALTVDKFLDHAAKWSGNREIVTADRGPERRAVSDTPNSETRSNRLSGRAAQRLGSISATGLALLRGIPNIILEMYYAAMGAGFVCHTLNPRLHRRPPRRHDQRSGGPRARSCVRSCAATGGTGSALSEPRARHRAWTAMAEGGRREDSTAGARCGRTRRCSRRIGVASRWGALRRG